MLKTNKFASFWDPKNLKKLNSKIAFQILEQKKT